MTSCKFKELLLDHNMRCNMQHGHMLLNLSLTQTAQHYCLRLDGLDIRKSLQPELDNKIRINSIIPHFDNSSETKT